MRTLKKKSRHCQTLREQFEALLVNGALRVEDVTALLGLANSAAQPWLDDIFSGLPGDKDSTIDVDAFIRFLETGELVPGIFCMRVCAGPWPFIVGVLMCMSAVCSWLALPAASVAPTRK